MPTANSPCQDMPSPLSLLIDYTIDILHAAVLQTLLPDQLNFRTMPATKRVEKEYGKKRPHEYISTREFITWGGNKL